MSKVNTVNLSRFKIVVDYSRDIKVDLPGKYKDTDEVGDNGSKSQDRHCNAFDPKSTTLYGAVLLHIQVPTMTSVQVQLRFMFFISFKGLKFPHCFFCRCSALIETRQRTEERPQRASLSCRFNKHLSNALLGSLKVSKRTS